MLGKQPVLIVEDEFLIALELASEVEAMDGCVVGPAASVADAIAILDQQPVSAAILDANLTDRDVTPLAIALAELGVPFVVHSAVGIPHELTLALPDVPFVAKPASARAVIARLISRMTGQ
ncbi:MAG: response regulator [Croceibacterium sp.]